MSPLIRCVALLASSLLLSHASAEVHSWTGATYSRTHTIKPKKILEVCADISAQQSVAWKFSAGGDVDFNVHRHAGPGGKQVIYDVEATRVRERSGTLAHAAAHEWCWMWTNVSTSDVQLNVNLAR